MSEINEKQTCRKLYSQIVSGYSAALLFNSKVYIKHFSDNEFSSFEEDFENFFKMAQKKGLHSEAEKLKEIISLEHWSDEEEQKLQDIAGSISDAARQENEAPQQSKAGVRKFMRSLQNKERALQRVRDELMGTTADTYAQRKNNEQIIFRSLFKDPECKTAFFEQDEFDDLEQEQLLEAISLYNKNMEFFTEKWVKKVAVIPSFLNSFFLCDDNPQIFFGKAVIDLTIYQADLFSKGKYFKSILNESELDGPPDTDYEESLQKVVNWYDFQYSVIKSKRESEAVQSRAQSRRSSSGRR